MLNNFLAKLSPKEKKIFYVAVFILSLAMLDRVFLGPATNRISEMEEEIKSIKMSMQQDQQFLSYQDRITQESRSFAKYIPRQLKDNDEINTEFFRNIEELSKKSQIDLIKSNPAQTKDEEGYIEYHANLDIAGTLENVIGFMHTLNASEELFKVVRFDMTKRRGTEDQVQTSMTVVKLIIKPNQP